MQSSEQSSDAKPVGWDSGRVPGSESKEPGTWSFDEGVTKVFDDMLQRTIPDYHTMRDIVYRVGRRFVPSVGGEVVALGASRGEDVANLVDEFDERARFTLCEVSEPMLEVLRSRFAKQIRSGTLHARNLDLRDDYPSGSYNLTLAVLTMCFIPLERRQRLARRIFQHTRPGGALVMVDKILCDTSEIDSVIVDAHEERKRERGYSQEDIDRKRLALEGLLVPVTARWNRELLHQAGFRDVDCIWRWGNFAAWLALRE